MVRVKIVFCWYPVTWFCSRRHGGAKDSCDGGVEVLVADAQEMAVGEMFYSEMRRAAETVARWILSALPRSLNSESIETKSKESKQRIKNRHTQDPEV